MATLARRLRLGVTSIFMLSGLVGTFWGQVPFFPPPVQFINDARITGTLQTQGMTLPITGLLDYLIIGGSVDTRLGLLRLQGQQITRTGEVYNITQTSTNNVGFATYSWTWAGTGQAIAPMIGQFVTVTGTTNGNGIFNVTDGVIRIVTGGPTSGTFTLFGFPVTIAAAPETGQAQIVGNYLWVTSTPTGSNESEIVSTDLTTPPAKRKSCLETPGLSILPVISSATAKLSGSHSAPHGRTRHLPNGLVNALSACKATRALLTFPLL